MPLPDPPTGRRTPSPSAVLAIAGFGAFLAFLDSTIVNVAFPSIQTSFKHSSFSTLSWVLNAYNIVFAGFLVVLGRLSDLLGRRRLFLGGVVVFTVASVLCAASTSVGELIAFRVVQGLGAAALVPASLGLVTEAFPRERLTHGVSLWGAAAALAAGLGPPIGGALVSGYSWRLAFLVNVPFGIAAVLVGRRGLVESRAPGRRRLPDLRGALLLAAAIGVLTTAIIEGSTWGWGSARVIGCLAATAALSLAFAVSNREHAAPVLDPTLLRTRQFAVANLVTIVAAAGFYAYTLNHILWLHYVWHYSLLRAGLSVAPGALVAAATAAVLGRVADERGHRPIVLTGAAVWALALGYFYAHRVGVHPDFLGQWLPAQVISGIGVGATLPIVSSAGLVGVSGGRYGAASAAVSSSRQLGAVLGVAILTAIVGTAHGLAALTALRHGWDFSAVCFLAAGLGALALPSARAAAAAGAAAGAADPVAVVGELPSAAFGLADTHEVVLNPGAAARRRRTAAAPFLRLPPEVARELDAIMRPVELPGGQWLFERGDRADGLYIVDSGQLEVLIDGRLVGRLGQGDVVGELALLTDAPRSASVRARRDTTLRHLSSRKFRALAARQPAVPLALATALAQRLQAIHQPQLPPSRARVITVVGVTDAMPAAAVAAQLATLLEQRLRVAAPGRVDPAGLERAEASSDLVLLVAESTDAPPWREFCLRGADRVVVVAPSGDVRAPGWLGRRNDADRDLVFCGSRPTREATLAWWDALAPLSAHHYDPGQAAPSLRPLADRLAGRSIGLVLAGGGARALGHLGVLDEIEAAGITVDRVAGTSLGAVIAAGYASGMTAAEVDACVHEEFVRRNPLRDYRIPRHGLIGGERTRAALTRRLGDVLIEELPREFRCVSVDLIARQTVVHSRGSLADAVMASLRIPGLFAPHRMGDSLHVDGGVMDNLPVDALAANPEGPIVAVNISFGQRSGGHLGPPRMPSLSETMMRTMLISADTRTSSALEKADLVISPSSEGVGLFEWHQIDVMREAGRRAAREAMPALQALAALPVGAAPPERHRRRSLGEVSAAR